VHLAISGILGLPVITGNHFLFPHPVLPNEDYHLVMLAAFLPWSSGAFLLKDLVVEYYHTFTGDPAHYPVDFQLSLNVTYEVGHYTLLNVPFGVLTGPNLIPLPPRTVPYWGDGYPP